MKKDELILMAKEKVDEISKKIEGFEKRMKMNGTEEIKEKAKIVLEQLKKMKSEIETHYLEVENNKEVGSSNTSEIEKNIFTSIKSFNDAFTKAGSIFGRK